jgi:nitric oxide reductase subunit B
MESDETTFSIKRLWAILVVGMVVMFGIPLLLGQQIYQ